MSVRTFTSESIELFPDENILDIWKHFVESLRSNLPRQAFETWIQPMKPCAIDGETFYVQVPSRFYYDWIEGHYASQVERALEETFSSPVKLVYMAADKEAGDSGTVPTVPGSVPRCKSPADYAVVSPSFSRGNGSTNLNPRYTFDTFIEGPPNRFARAASQAVAAGKTSYNPLLIYGGVGLGKTHLLQAIGNEAFVIRPGLNIKYIDSENFTQDFVDAIKHNRADEFSAKYRHIDVLLLDDVQFLVGRERTQMEFFHTFNTLHQAGKQIVLTSDKPPRDLDGLDERLVSRIGWGLVCDIGPPDFDTRVAIVLRLAEEEGHTLPADVCTFLAEKFDKNVRDLEGAFVRLVAHASLNGSRLTVEKANHILRDSLIFRKPSVTLSQIQLTVSSYYNIPADLLIAKIRSQPVAKARMVAMWLGLEMCGLSLKEIGRNFGNRDHTTVLHAKKKVNKWIKDDKEFSKSMEELKERIYDEAS